MQAERVDREADRQRYGSGQLGAVVLRGGEPTRTCHLSRGVAHLDVGAQATRSTCDRRRHRERRIRSERVVPESAGDRGAEHVLVRALPGTVSTHVDQTRRRRGLCGGRGGEQDGREGEPVCVGSWQGAPDVVYISSHAAHKRRPSIRRRGRHLALALRESPFDEGHPVRAGPRDSVAITRSWSSSVCTPGRRQTRATSLLGSSLRERTAASRSAYQDVPSESGWHDYTIPTRGGRRGGAASMARDNDERGASSVDRTAMRLDSSRSVTVSVTAHHGRSRYVVRSFARNARAPARRRKKRTWTRSTRADSRGTSDALRSACRRCERSTSLSPRERSRGPCDESCLWSRRAR